MTSQDLDDALDLLRNRLDRSLVYSLDSGDFAENLLAHFRQRREPKLLFSPDNLTTIARLAKEYDPDEAAWEREIADNAVEGRMYGASNAYCRRFIDVDRETFDFSEYEHEDPQTIRGLNRHRWYAALARTYWEDQDERYFHALMREWDFFCDKVPFPGEEFYHGIHAIGEHNLWPPYGELDTYIRLTNWYFAYWLSLHAPEMTADRHAVLLARCLQHFDLVAARGIKTHEHNFTSMQMEALYLWASALPEVPGMTVWKHAARNIFESSLGRAIFDDGVQWERSAGYHIGCLRWYSSSFLLGQRNDEPWAEPYRERLRQMTAFADSIITPDGNVHLLSDSDRVDTWRTGLALAACIFPDFRFQRQVRPSYYSLWVSNGTTWDDREPAPLEEQIVFPMGGYGILNSPGAEHANQAVMSNGSTLAGHAHQDNLSIIWEAAGRPAIVDPGRWVYRGDYDRFWVLSPDAHNTPIPQPSVEGGQWAIDTTQPGDRRVAPIESLADDEWLCLKTTLAAYTADALATVSRRIYMSRDSEHPWLVVVDAIQGGEAHPWTTSWLIPADQDGEWDASNYRSQLTSGVHFAMTWLPGDLDHEEHDKFWCPNYAEKSPGRWLRFRQSTQQQRRLYAFTAHPEAAPIPELETTDNAITLTIPDWCQIALPK